MERHITVPVAKEEIQDLRAGDYVYLTGVIYTARDAAHKRTVSYTHLTLPTT